MMPDVVRFRQTAVAAEQESTVSLTGDTVLNLIRDLHHAPADRETIPGNPAYQKISKSEQEALKKIWDWIKEDRLYQKEQQPWDRWSELVKKLH